ncbi:MAG: amino acid adenylation domain-containing protein [Ignavibacteriales bacterium]
MTDSNLYPLSLPQEAFYYDYLLNRNNCKYIMGGALILEGDLNIELYGKAYNYVIEHYDALRIKFVQKGDVLFQQFRPEYKCEIKYLDFRSRRNPVEEAIDLILKNFRKPLSLEDDELFSEMILQTAEHKYIFAPVFHHMINDGAGRAIVNQAIADTYNSLLEKGCYAELKPFSYIDFINDDLKYRDSDAYKNSFGFWKQKLADLPESFGFTSKKKSIKNISLHTERIVLNLHRVCFESILDMGFKSDATTFQVILGLITTALHRCYKRNEMIIGMPVLNRSNYIFRNTPGLFMNMMPLRLNIESEGTFEDILNTIKSEVRECYRHQRFPLGDTLKYLRTNPEFNNELFDVTVIYRKNDYSQRFGGAKLHSITFDTEIRNESLSIEIDEYDEEGNVNIFFNYNPLVISGDEIVQFVRCFETILLDLVHFPAKSLNEITLLNDFDSHKILNEFNSSREEITTSRTIIELFEETVYRRPGADAVICNEMTVSYEELNKKANQIADYLIANYDVQSEEIICMALDRSTDAIAAMIGIMKTGAAYLPIDIEYPVDRIKYIIENSGARILIKGSLAEKDLAENVIELSDITSLNDKNVEIKIKPDNLAYIIYTSGSTGKPKGVLIEHAQFMSMFVNVIGSFGVKETDRVLQFASLGFDASVFEIFQALLMGAALVIADKDVIRNPASFISYMEKNKVTVATLPPVYLNVLDKAELPHLHTLITAGEQAIASDVNFYKKNKRYINAYGPTEASVCVSYYTAEKDEEYSYAVPIGKPAPNSKLYILDESLRPVPIGFPGELCVSGPGLARGYLNNDELTKQKYIINPFEAGSRLYRTGDIAKWRHDGNIEFLGRIDGQVKINGNRIEPGEIEAQIAKYDKINEVTVLDIQSGDGKSLAAYISTPNAIDIDELKRYLRKFLPEYMIPRHYVIVEKIPLTHNGKINKEALRKMPVNIAQNKTELSVAASEIERRLISIFEEVLGISPVGADDNIFALGGDSLKIARLITRIHKELKRELEFKVIYESPTVRSIAAELEGKAITGYRNIPAFPQKEYYALSHAQKRIWILAQNKENAAVYHMPVSLLLKGPLNLKALDEALKVIVERHETLRTVFNDINGIPGQKVLDDYNFTIEKHDLSAANYKDATLRKFVEELITVPFDLTFQIPIRVNVIRLEEEKNVLLIIIHHIAGDGISIGIIMKELSELYNSFCSGSAVKLKPLRIQYKDYCEYEKELIESSIYNEEREYWIKKLNKPLPVLELPCDKPRPPVKTYSGNYLFYEIENILSGELIAFCKEQNVSLYNVMTAVVNILLHKYSSQEEIITGSPISGRNHPDIEDQVGVYINTVALRNKISSAISFKEFLNKVKINSTEALSNSNYPFDLLIQDLDLDRDTSRTPVFDVLVQLQNQDSAGLKLNGISVSFYEADFKLNKFDLTFTFVEEDHKVKFSIGYNTDLFKKERIDRAARHIKNIIAYILRHPANVIKEIDLLDISEKENLKNISYGAKSEYNTLVTIPELFEEQVKKSPNNTALIFEDKSYTYAELDKRANTVANEIILRSKISADDVIGIMTSRSELMVIGILGVLKTGAAYMPIDPEYPVERISYMLRDSKSKLLLTESGLLSIAENAALADRSEFSETKVLDISLLKGLSNNKPELNLISSNLAYVIYTSGSTGKPKGVMIGQRSLHNLVLGLANAIYTGQTAPLNIALIAPFVFDASVKQIFYALLNGHCLDIVPDEVRTSGRKLLEYYEKHRIDVSDGTPVHLEIILDELKAGVERYLPERFVIGGQQLMYQTVKKIFDITGNNSPVISNVYGPTECCDVSTCYNITPETLLKSVDTFNALSVGKPLNNVQIYILDSNLSRVPIGVSGELYIAGDGLARGYINRPDLTEEKYILYDGIRIYNTGDIGRYLDDGNIVLSGRTDDQIKLRGFRIELNEIENCLKQYKGINSAAVIPVGEGQEQEIAAYYCTTDKIESSDIRQYLSLHLPGYMIPAYFVEMINIPLTINGKVDRKALPVPVKEISIEDNTSLPGDILEEKLCEIWKELLQVERIGLTDNFFKLGGHSLIAIRLTSRIHKEFNIEINIWEVFQYPTVASLAKLIRSKNPSLFNPIEKIKENEYYALSHAQRRLWLLAKLEGQNSLYNLPGAFHMKGVLNIQALENTFKAIVQRHESFRTCFIEIDGEPFQKILETVDFNIETAEYTGKTWDENILKELAYEYFQNEFDLSKAPLLQIKIIKLYENYHLLLLNMHHIISDGWSIKVMLKEIETYYSSFLNGYEAPLKPLRIQYKDYAAWQNKILGEKSLEAVKEYWEKKLSKPRPLLDLPADYKRSENYSIDGELIHFILADGPVRKLMDISSSQNASIYMALLSVVYILLHKYTRQEDILIGTPVAGRQHYDLEGQIGYFINTLVLRNEISPEDSFQEILSKVKETLSGAFDNQVYPFDRLVDELDVERIRNRNPLFDVMVAWMVTDGMRMKTNIGGIEAEGLDFRIAKSMFDLTFLFEENEGQVSFAIEYNTSLFKHERIRRMSDHFKRLVEVIAADPKEKIKNLELVSAREKEELLFEFNEQNNSENELRNVIGLFNNQAEINKNNVSLVYDGREVTFDELNKLSNRIANHIIKKITPQKDDIIAVIIDDPVWAVAAILAVMKAGAAYLPILPDTPPERMAFIINDSNSKAVLVDSNLHFDNIRPDKGKVNENMLIDVRGKLCEDQSTPDIKIDNDSLAYVIYTSGSTGVPKGVMIEHSSLANLISSLNGEVYSHYTGPINELMISSFAFDVSLKQVFAALCNGNILHILNKERRLDPREIINYIINSKINIADITPSVFAVMLEEGFAEINKPDLKEIFLGSEALPFKLVKEFYSIVTNKNIKVTNFYGPTECCVESSSFRFNADMKDVEYDIAPIGKPILNEQIYILDNNLNLCPVGVPGEICIAGKGLARQYLNDPKKTEEKFVQFPSLKGTRIYRTGDLGRTLNDGNIEFLGRMDEQIKIRGYRVELQEIEKHLRILKEIKSCAVTLYEKNGTGELAAYYTSDETVSQAVIKNHLNQFLPQYMIPSYYIQLENIPLSSNGKTNKLLLPDPTTGYRKKDTIRAPKNEIEHLILKICSGILQKDDISLEDNFFEIGGHSLNAVRMISQVQKQLDIDLALKEIFYNPVLGDIAETVKKLSACKNTSNEKIEEETIIVPMSDDELAFLSTLQFDDEE